MSSRRPEVIVLKCRMAVAASVLSSALACGGSSPSGPSPTPPPVTPPAAQTFTLSGTVRDSSTNAPVPVAAVQFMTGINAGRLATTASDGSFSLSGLRAGSGLVRAYAPEYPALEVTVVIPLPTAESLEFVLGRLAQRPNPGPYTYSGIVWDSRGEPVAGAAIVLIRDSGANPLGIVSSGADGTFSITTQSTANTIRVTRDGFVSVENPAPPALAPATVVNVTIPRITAYALHAIPNLRVGQSATLLADVDTDDGLRSTGRAYTSTTSSNEAVVAVPALGNVLARAPGNATITATYSGLTSTATVQVVP